MKAMIPAISLTLLYVLLPGCAGGANTLEEDNATLRALVESLEAKLALLQSSAPVPTEMTSIRSFTVGLAAAQKDFDESAFVKLLAKGIEGAAEKKTHRITREDDQREVDKIRGMLLHQSLAAKEIPITISNLSYKLQDTDNDFIIGERVVPRDSVQLTRATGAGVHARFKGPLAAIMARDNRGNYSIAYEERGGGKGSVPIPITDVEIMDPQQRPHSARQGDLSLNWRLSLSQLQVYRVENFQGDVGRFLRTMRYPGPEVASISQYQTLRDSVFLFGYGNYVTGLVNQIRTPSYITEVEVVPLDAGVFGRLEGGMGEDEILELVAGSDRWVPCGFVEYTKGDKVWDRPSEMGFPFLSRQYREDKNLTFYTKYDAKGQTLIGDFERSQ